MKIGFPELIVVFIVALLVLGPDKLPVYAKKLGTALSEFRKASEGLTKDIRESVIEPLEEAQRPLREAIEPLEELNKEVRGNIKGVQKELNNIGKPKPEPKAAPEQEAEPAAPVEEAAVEAPVEELASAEAPAEETAPAVESAPPAEEAEPAVPPAEKPETTVI